MTAKEYVIVLFIGLGLIFGGVIKVFYHLPECIREIKGMVDDE